MSSTKNQEFQRVNTKLQAGLGMKTPGVIHQLAQLGFTLSKPWEPPNPASLVNSTETYHLAHLSLSTC